MSSIKRIPTLIDAGDLKHARVVVRVGLNVPIADTGTIGEPFRLEVIIPTLKRLQQSGARTLLLAHIGSTPHDSLRPVHRYLESKLGPIRFVDHLPFDAGVLESRDIALLENIRRFEGETENDERFAGQIARGADMYINEAFSDSHRVHASIVGIPRLIPSYIGPWFETELRELTHAFDPAHPFELIVGGAKIATKLPLVKKFLDRADSVFVGGALANDLFEAQGYEVGRSLVSNDIELSDVLKHPHLVMPQDVVVEDGGGVRIGEPTSLTARDSIMDVGPESLVRLKKRVDTARTIVWNGPVGNTDGGYKEGTEAIAEMIRKASAHSIVGGGDTIAAISAMDAFDRFGFVSTGGGAMLDYLASETLPGIEAITQYWQ
ncbi:MAG: phosphoglycerate kinase [bacterium]|nr:phosphoglycerate kinase [bacterium]